MSVYQRFSMKLTPETLVAAPRRSSAVPNADGTLLLHTVSRYHLDAQTTTTEIRVMHVETQKSSLVSSNPADYDPIWLDDGDWILFLRDGKGGETELWTRNAGDMSIVPYLVGKIDGPVSCVKTKRLQEGVIAIAFAGKAAADGTMYNPSKASKGAPSSAREYDSLPVRYWDHWVTEEQSTIWYTSLVRVPREEFELGRKYVLFPSKPINALKGTGLQSPPLREVPTSNDLDISSSGIVFVAKPPRHDPTRYFGADVYYIRLRTFTEDPTPTPQLLKVQGFEGICDSPVFSPNGTHVAFLKSKSSETYYGHHHLFCIEDLNDPNGTLANLSQTTDGFFLEYSLSCVKWGNDNQTLYLIVEDQATMRLLQLSGCSTTGPILRPLLFDYRSVTDFYPLGHSSSRLIISHASFVDSSQYYILDYTNRFRSEFVSSGLYNGTSFGLYLSQISEIHFKGGENGKGGYAVQAWVVKPSHFDEQKSYPLAIMLHGGPASGGLNIWSTRWNPVLFAEQGYIVVYPNFTGSTGFGPDFVDAIRHQWGGRPYHDVVQCFEHVKYNMPYADTSRAVALGGSYGGYLISWILGQPLAKEFKAFVMHDGLVSLPALYSGDVMDTAHDFGGHLWEEPEADYTRWDPIRHTKNWNTPTLVIHSDLDYRTPITNGLAIFTILQSRGVKSKLLNFPDENHWVLKPENSLQWNKTVLAWINKFVGISQSG